MPSIVPGASKGAVASRRAWAYDLYLAGLIIAAFLADQGTKGWVRGNMLIGEALPADGFFRLVHTYNTGSAFGLFPNQTFLLMIASIVGIGILVFYFRSQPIPPFWLRTSMGLQLGGAAGNLVDRMTLGHVTDFISVGPWPVFNLADSSIMVGIGILAWFLWRSPKQSSRGKAEAGLPAEDGPSAQEHVLPQEEGERKGDEEVVQTGRGQQPSQDGGERRG
ncbi:MAG: signal peptidase II [Chloroflexi bacterium]|nr:signal peptidase II [Chloroflexota bacterium]